MAGVSLTDGSGLTRRNRLTGRALAKLLLKARKEPWFDSFYALVPGGRATASGSSAARCATG